MRKTTLVCWLLLITGAAPVTQYPIRPDPTMTPGAFNIPSTPLAILCAPGHAESVRHVSITEKRRVMREYGLNIKDHGLIEIDHLVPLEIDGGNEIKNLWPQNYTTRPYNAHVKDVLEDTLHRMVCNQQLDLPTAQHDIATDWIAAYNKYVLHEVTQHDITVHQTMQIGERGLPRLRQNPRTDH